MNEWKMKVSQTNGEGDKQTDRQLEEGRTRARTIIVDRTTTTMMIGTWKAEESNVQSSAEAMDGLKSIHRERSLLIFPQIDSDDRYNNVTLLFYRFLRTFPLKDKHNLHFTTPRQLPSDI